LGFFSHKLEQAHTRFNTFDPELLACVAAIKHFLFILKGRIFTIYTDHKLVFVVGLWHATPTHGRPDRAAVWLTWPNLLLTFNMCPGRPTWWQMPFLGLLGQQWLRVWPSSSSPSETPVTQ
jgi:hypothetical protein